MPRCYLEGGCKHLSSYTRLTQKCENYTHVFRVKLIDEINRNAVQPNRERPIQDGRFQIRNTLVSACRNDWNTISKAISVVSRSIQPIKQSRTLHNSWKRKFQDGSLQTGSIHISSAEPNRNEIPNSIPIFSEV